MPYTDMWEIIDDNGTIHSGTEEEMKQAFDIMKCPGDFTGEVVDEYYTDWDGDLRLVQIHDIYN